MEAHEWPMLKEPEASLAAEEEEEVEEVEEEDDLPPGRKTLGFSFKALKGRKKKPVAAPAPGAEAAVEEKDRLLQQLGSQITTKAPAQAAREPTAEEQAAANAAQAERMAGLKRQLQELQAKKAAVVTPQPARSAASETLDAPAPEAAPPQAPQPEPGAAPSAADDISSLIDAIDNIG